MPDGEPTEPQYQERRHKATGEMHRLVSHDGGATWEREPDEAQVPPATPAPAQAPPREPLGVPGIPGTAKLEAASLAAPAGLTGDWSDELMARIDASANVARSALPGAQAPLTGTPARTSGRGIDAPLKTVDEYLAEKRGRVEQAFEEEPETAYPYYGFGAVTQAVATPALKAAKAAPLLEKLATGAGNVAVDTALAATAAGGASEAETIEGMYEDVGEGAKFGAAVSGGLRAIPAAGRIVKAAAGAGTRTAARTLGPGIAARRTLGAPGDVKEDAARFLEQTPEGEALRAQARAGEQVADEDIASVVGLITKAQRVSDVVENMGNLSLKPRVFEAAMEASPSGGSARIAEVGDALVDKADTLAADLSAPGRYKVTGPGKKLRDATDDLYGDFLQGLEQGGPAGHANAMVSLDKLKRVIGDLQGTRDFEAKKALQALYHEFRDALQDAGTWGTEAAGKQSRVNLAHTEFLGAEAREVEGGGFSRLFLRGSPEERAASGFRQAPQGRRVAIERVLEGAGTEAGKDVEQVLRVGLDRRAKLANALAEVYELPPEIQKLAAESSQYVEEVGQTLEGVTERAGAARRLGEVERATADAPAGVLESLPLVGRAVRAVDQGGPAQLARRLGSYEAEAAAPRAAGAPPGPVSETLSTATTTAARIAGAEAPEPPTDQPPVSLSDKIQRLVLDNPEQLGPYGPGLRAAAEQGEGAFGVRHHILQQTDPQYQQLLRELELEEIEQ